MPITFLTAQQVAEIFQVHVETIYVLIKEDGLPAAKIGHRWRFEESKVRDWFENRYLCRESGK